MTWMDEYAPPPAWRVPELEAENIRLRRAVVKALKFVERYRSLMPAIEEELGIDEEEAAAEEKEVVDELECLLHRALKRGEEKSQ